VAAGRPLEPLVHLLADVYAGVEAPGSALDTLAITLRFFDRFVKGEDNGVDEQPRVHLYDLGDSSWKARERWQGATAEREIFLAADASLSAAPGADDATSYRYDPTEPNGLRFDFSTTTWEPPLDLTELEAQSGVVSWTGEPLGEDATLHGWGEVVLWATTDGEDTEWHVKLADVDEGGRATCIAWGCLRASHAADPSNPAPVVPGEPTRYAIELAPAFRTFKAGHRIRLVLASSEFPWFARNMNRFGPIAQQSEPRTAVNTVLHGSSYPSSLRLRFEQA
jgi:putative CocE/NonD family hydrolase